MVNNNSILFKISSNSRTADQAGAQTFDACEKAIHSWISYFPSIGPRRLTTRISIESDSSLAEADFDLWVATAPVSSLQVADPIVTSSSFSFA